jgi:hypothetical protein
MLIARKVSAVGSLNREFVEHVVDDVLLPVLRQSHG